MEHPGAGIVGDVLQVVALAGAHRHRILDQRRSLHRVAVRAHDLEVVAVQVHRVQGLAEVDQPPRTFSPVFASSTGVAGKDLPLMMKQPPNSLTTWR